MKVSRFEDLTCWQGGGLTPFPWGLSPFCGLPRPGNCPLIRATDGDRHVADGEPVPCVGSVPLPQMRRASISIMANIAEGFMRRSDKEFVQYLYTAMSSAAEVQSHLYVALDAHYVSEDQCKALYDQATKAGKLASG